MDLVIDANILFSVLIVPGDTEDLVFQEDIHLFAPEFIFVEFEKYKELILEKTQRTSEEFYSALNILKKKIKIIPFEETSGFLEKAKSICPDEKDAEYFALALKLGCPLWSNDKKLKEQSQVKVYSTEELAGFFR